MITGKSYWTTETYVVVMTKFQNTREGSYDLTMIDNR